MSDDPNTEIIASQPSAAVDEQSQGLCHLFPRNPHASAATVPCGLREQKPAQANRQKLAASPHQGPTPNSQIKPAQAPRVPATPHPPSTPPPAPPPMIKTVASNSMAVGPAYIVSSHFFIAFIAPLPNLSELIVVLPTEGYPNEDTVFPVSPFKTDLYKSFIRFIILFYVIKYMVPELGVIPE